MSEMLQVWVRNDKGQVYGPLTPPSVELLIDNGVIGGKLQVSTNGENYVYPGRVPGLRMIFPRETWGDTIIPGEQLDAEWGKVVLPAAIGGAGAVPTSTPSGITPGGPVGAPMAGPGARAPAGGPVVRGPAPGPGTRTQPSGIRAPPMGGPVRPPVAQPPAGIPRSSPSIADFMNAAGPVPAAAPVSRPSSPSVADFMNSANPGAPSSSSRVPTTPAAAVAAVAPAAPAAPAAAPRSSSSGVRMVAAPSAGGPVDMPASGTLETTSTAQLYYLAASGELTGLLTLKLADRELQVHFKKGNPEFLDSTHPEDSLETFLVSQKLATQAQIDQGQAQAGRFGGDLLPALFGLGLLNPNAVFQHLGARASNLLFRVLTAEQGSFSFDAEEFPAARSMPLGNKWAVYLEALRKLSAPDVRRRVMGAFELPVMKAAGRVGVTDVRLTPQETRAHNYFDGVRSLSQLVRDLPGEADVIVRTAWMLEPLELVSFAGVVLTAKAAAPQPPPPRVAAPPPAPKPVAPAPVAGPPKISAPAPVAPAAAAPARPAPPVMTAAAPKPVTAPGNPAQMPKPAVAAYPGGAPQAAAPKPPPKPAAPAAPAAPAEDAKQLEALLVTMKASNFFDVLGLKKEADANQVKIAYLKAARSYHPDTVPPGSPEALARVKADIFALIGEANRTLSDPKLRADYVAELSAGGTGSKVDIEKLLRAEDFFQKGRILVQARKYADAVKIIDEAIACNPDEAEFYAWRGYAKFLLAPDKKAAQSDVLKDIKHCIEKNPNVASAHYFMGYVAKALGDTRAAMEHFKRTVALDPRHIDAARELRAK